MNGFKRIRCDVFVFDLGVGSKQEILSVVRVCDETLRTRLKEFGNTAAGMF